MSAAVAYLSIGSNMGNKLENCRSGVDALVRAGACRVLAWSPFYRTEPVDLADQDWFVNAVIQVETALAPEDLLKAMLAVERGAGRVRGGERFGPRVLDLDLIFFGDRVIDRPALQVPHPRMHKRRFVLQPMCDINPLLRHPLLNRTVQQLLDELDPEAQRVELLTCDC